MITRINKETEEVAHVLRWSMFWALLTILFFVS